MSSGGGLRRKVDPDSRLPPTSTHPHVTPPYPPHTHSYSLFINSCKPPDFTFNEDLRKASHATLSLRPCSVWSSVPLRTHFISRRRGSFTSGRKRHQNKATHSPYHTRQILFLEPIWECRPSMSSETVSIPTPHSAPPVELTHPPSLSRCGATNS